MIAGLYLGLLLIGILLLVLTVWLLNRLLVRDITRRKQEEQLSPPANDHDGGGRRGRSFVRPCGRAASGLRKVLAGTSGSPGFPVAAKMFSSWGRSGWVTQVNWKGFNSPRRKPVSSRGRPTGSRLENRSIQPG